MKWWWFLIAAIIIVVTGVTLGFIVDLTPSSPSGPDEPTIREVLLGTPAVPPTADQPWQATKRLTQKRQYTTLEPLALRVVSDEPADRSIQLNVRLLQKDGSHQALQPGTITVAGGTGGHCCWYITTPGMYQLQIFRGGEAPLTIPVTIVKGVQNAKSPLQAL